MKGSLTMSAVIPATAEEIWKAWLSTRGHSDMTGSPARATARVGARFTAWDGYIMGTNLELTPGRRIVQSWRTTDFPPDAPDSRLAVELASTPRGTRVTLKHTSIPDGQVAGYRQGWTDYYFEPMKKYFGL